MAVRTLGDTRPMAQPQRPWGARTRHPSLEACSGMPADRAKAGVKRTTPQVHRLHSIPYSSPHGPLPSQILINILHTMKQIGLGPRRNRPNMKYDKAPLGAVPRRKSTQVAADGRASAKIYLGLRAVPHDIGVPIQRPPRRGWLHVAFRARAPWVLHRPLGLWGMPGIPSMPPYIQS